MGASSDPERSVGSEPRRARRAGGRHWHRGILLLTLRDLQMRAVRFASAIIGTAVVFTLLFLMTGLNEQFKREPVEVVSALGSDHWLLGEGESGVFTSAATMPVSVGRDIKGVDAVPMVAARYSISEGGTRTDIVIIGYSRGRTGEPDVVAGRLPEKSGEVTVDATSVFDVGASILIGHTEFTVVGHSEDTTLFAGMTVVFMSNRDAQALLFRGEQLASALLLSGPPDQVPEGFAVLSGDEIAQDALRPLEGATASVNLVRVLLWFVAAMIIGTMTYLSALDRRRDVAVLKAVGASTSQLAASIALQGFAIAVVAVAVSMGLQALIAPTFPLQVTIPVAAYIQIPVIAVLVALVAGVAGLRNAVSTDPALAFSGAGS